MKLGLGSYAFGWAASAGRINARQLVERAAELGLTVVQIADNLPLQHASKSELASLRTMGVEIELGARGAGRDYLCRYIAACHDLGSTLLRLVIDSPGDEPSLDQAAERIAAIVPELEAASVTLAIENHDRLRAAEFACIVRRVNSPRVGICLDTANSFGSLEGPEVVFDALLPLTVNLHLKDFAIHRFANSMGFRILGTPAGSGRLDCPALIQRLHALRPAANVILELWPPEDEDLESTLRKEELWVRQSIDYLRPLIPA